jgi:hypothetical protein
MKEINSFTTKIKDESGIALVIVMGLLVLLVVLAIAFASSQITENKATLNFYYASLAENLAKGGLDHAIALLEEDLNTSPEYDSYFERWGYLYQQNNASDSNNGFSVSDYDDGLEPGVDLHPYYSFVDEDFPTTVNTNQDARWIYVTDSTETEPVTIGRYAVFIEDESSKFNMNYSGANTNSVLDATDTGVESINPYRIFQEIYNFIRVSDFNDPDIADNLLNYRVGGGIQLITSSEFAFAMGDPDFTLDTFVDSFSYYVTIHSKERNGYYNGSTWVPRVCLSGIGDTETLAIVRAAVDTALSGIFAADVVNQIAVNIYDYFDADSLPTRYPGSNIFGIEKTPYILEIDADPEDLSDTEDYGEYIILWNPYNEDLDTHTYDLEVNGVPIRSNISFSANEYVAIVDKAGTSYGFYVENKPDTPDYSGSISQTYGHNLSISYGDTFTLTVNGTGEIIETVQLSDPGQKRRSMRKTSDPRLTNPSEWSSIDNIPNRGMNFYNPSAAERATLHVEDTATTDPLVEQLGKVFSIYAWIDISFDPSSGFLRLLDTFTDTSVGTVFGKININTAPLSVMYGLKGFDSFSNASDTIPMTVYLHRSNIGDITSFEDLVDMLNDPANNAGSTFFTETALINTYDLSEITIKSDVFRVIVLAQSLDPGGNIGAERKLEAIVDRGRNSTDGIDVLYFRWMTE